jgi:hypothetical protein
MPIKIPQKAGKPYRPSNGTEGMIFEENYCEQCKKCNEDGCIILFSAVVYEINEPLYPKEWVFDSEGSPTCTAFEKL